MSPIASSIALALPLLAFHEGLQEQVAGLDRRIRSDPRSVELVLERAELHRLRADWASAGRDLARVRELDPNARGLELLEARIYLDLARFEAARAALIAAKERGRSTPELHAMLARAESRLGHSKASIRAWAEYFETSPHTSPEDWLALSEELASCGEQGCVRAVAVLDQGLARLGPCVSLTLAAIHEEERLGRIDDALARLDVQLAGVPRATSWLVLRGEILERAGRLDAALATFEEAAASIRSGRRRHTARNTELRNLIDARIAALRTPPSDPTGSAVVPPKEGS